MCMFHTNQLVHEETLLGTASYSLSHSTAACCDFTQTEAPRGGGGNGSGGYKESGLHVLYLLANSLVCLKGSGDCGESGAATRTIATGGAPTDDTFQPTASGDAAPCVIVLDGSDATQAAPLRSGPRLSSASNMNPVPPMDGSGATRREAPFSPAELASIRALALSDRAFPLLVHSLCPSIYGHELVKAGLLLGLFGGSSSSRSRTTGGGNGGSVGSVGGGGEQATGRDEGVAMAHSAKDFKVRPDIHVLVVGDPGLGKVSTHLRFFVVQMTIRGRF